MKKLISAIFVTGLLLSVATGSLEAQTATANRASNEQSTTKKSSRPKRKKGIVRKTAGDVDKGAKDVGKDVGKGSEKAAVAVGEGTEAVAKGTASDVDKGAKDAGKGVTKVAKKTGKATARAAKKVGRAFK